MLAFRRLLPLQFVVSLFTLQAAPPALEILTLENTTFMPGDTIAITAKASDPDNDLSHVEFLLNGALHSTDDTPPYEFVWQSSKIQDYQLTATAKDLAGNAIEDHIRLIPHHFPIESTIKDMSVHSAKSAVRLGDTFYVLSAEGPVFESQDLQNWNISLDPALVLPTELIATKETVIARGQGGLYYINPSLSNTWRYSDFTLGIRDVFPFDSGVVITRSNFPERGNLITNDFKKWESFDWPTGVEYLNTFASLKDRLIAATTSPYTNSNLGNSQVLYALDQDLNWETITLPTPGRVVSFMEDEENFLLLMHANGIDESTLRLYKSKDLDSWDEIPIQLPEEEQYHLHREGWGDIRRYHDIYTLSFRPRRSSKTFITKSLDSNWLALGEASDIYRIEKVDNTYYASTYINSYFSRIYESSDGINWEMQQANYQAPTRFHSSLIASEAGKLIYHHFPGPGARSFTQANGEQWKQLTLGSSDQNGTYIYATGNNIHFVTGNNSDLLSEDGQKWEVVPRPEKTTHEVIYGNGVFVRGTENGRILLSKNGRDWETIALVDSEYVRVSQLAFHETSKQLIAATGESPRAYWTSQDGKTWNNVTSPGEGHRYLQIANERLFLLSADPQPRTDIHIVYTSADTINWEYSYQGSHDEILPIYNQGIYLRKDNAKYILWSKDAKSWFPTGVGPAQTLAPINNGFSASYYSSLEQLFSTDGIHWVHVARATPIMGHNDQLRSILYPIENNYYTWGARRLAGPGVFIDIKGPNPVFRICTYGKIGANIEQSTDLIDWKTVTQEDSGVRAETIEINIPSDSPAYLRTLP